jgi:hypothetical protein
MILSSLPPQMTTQLFACAFKRAAKAGEVLSFCVRRMIPMDRKSPVDSHIGQRLKEYRQRNVPVAVEIGRQASIASGH